MAIRCGPFTFTGNFDAGNIGNAELVQSSEHADTSTSFGGYNVNPDYEVNVWTRPDCAGTKYQNGNRTWFYFGIKGGKPNAVLKLNILNLNKQKKLFEQGMLPVSCCIPERPKWERIKERVVILDQGIKENSVGISFRQKLPADTSTLFIAFTYPFSYTNMCEWLDNVDSIYLPAPTDDRALLLTADIYYRRELVCWSLERARVELLTISSSEGQLSVREEYLNNLFPDRDTLRPHKFCNKKVIFLSSRVHPGEVPAQFVMNGIIKFLIDEKDPRAAMLRKLFVFKIIPVLNPDGVYNGHYRTDPRGVNLNRVYLSPSPILHPSIYAARKLVLYAHHGRDTPDDYEYEVEVDTSVVQSDDDTRGDQEHESESRLCGGCIDGEPAASAQARMESDNLEDDDDSMMSKDDENIPVTERSSQQQMYEGHQCTFESCDEDSIVDYHDLKKISKAAVSGGEVSRAMGNQFSLLTASASNAGLAVPSTLISSEHHPSRSRNCGEKLRLSPKVVVTPPLSNNDATRFPKPDACSHLQLEPTGKESGLFLYIDMHGHATKRGIFMYGNHFKDIEVQTECMLLPRLMALNSPHFDFSACNFTERLMKLRDRRDGSSREGSGRVAILKLTGLIRSYTLECNYNTGRLVNHVVPRCDSSSFSDQVPCHSHHPPKFTPELFEGVGKSMGESILDLTGINPWTRLKATEYRSLDGLRAFLHRRLEHTIEYKASPSLRRATSAVPAVGGTKASPLPVAGTSKMQQNLFEFGSRSPVLKHKSVPRKISTTSASSSLVSGGPLIPKKENQSLVQKPQTSFKSLSKLPKTSTSLNKPTSSSKAKSKPKTKSAASPVVGAEGALALHTAPSSPPPDNHPSLDKVMKLTKKKKIMKSKSKKLKTFAAKRSESR